MHIRKQNPALKIKLLWVGLPLFLLGCTPPKPVSPAGVVDSQLARPAAIHSPPPGMVYVPEGTFLMGSTGLNNVKPVQVVVASFYLDQTEVTAEAYRLCVQAGKCVSPTAKYLFCNWDNQKMPDPVVAGKKQHPMNCVTFWEAKKYCEAQKKRLPTEMEWEYAARGSNQSLYPWGEDDPAIPSKRACWNRGGSATCAVKGYGATLLGMKANELQAQGLSGAYDLAGNVSEWVDTRHEETLQTKNKPCNAGSSSCVHRGGSWQEWKSEDVRAELRNEDEPTDDYPMLGFRCARS